MDECEVCVVVRCCSLWSCALPHYLHLFRFPPFLYFCCCSFFFMLFCFLPTCSFGLLIIYSFFFLLFFFFMGEWVLCMAQTHALTYATPHPSFIYLSYVYTYSSPLSSSLLYSFFFYVFFILFLQQAPQLTKHTVTVKRISSLFSLNSLIKTRLKLPVQHRWWWCIFLNITAHHS